MSQLDWKAEYAYTTGMQAFIYGFPYIYNSQLRHDWVTSKRDPDVVPYAAVDYFWHAARLIDASYRDGGCPNNDTLYSVAWLDLSKEPVILSHPDMADRYSQLQRLVGVRRRAGDRRRYRRHDHRTRARAARQGRTRRRRRRRPAHPRLPIPNRR